MNGGRVAVVGLGLIGGSMGAALRGAGYRVTGFDRDGDAAESALLLGLIDEIAHDLRTASEQADLVVVAVPLGAIEPVLIEVDVHAPPESVILDVGSAKRTVSLAIARLPGAGRCVGGHPIAGSERSGPANADPHLFKDRLFILTPSAVTEPRTLEVALEIVRAIGATPRTISAEEHDRVIARTSHLPQVLATALALTVGPSVETLAGTGLDSMTRLAASNPDMWADILLANWDELDTALLEFNRSIDRIREAVAQGDRTAIAELFLEGRRVRETLFVVAA